MNSSTRNYSLNAIRGCGQIPLLQSQLVDRMIERCIQINGILCVGTQWVAGSKEENAHHRCHFFTYITLEFRWWLRTRKVNLLFQESQYFTITLGSDFKGHFVHSIYYFTHMYIVIPLPAIPRSRVIPWGYFIWSTGSLQSKQMAYVSPGKLSY